MYAYFKGEIQDIQNTTVIIEVNNIGYSIFMAEDDISKLSINQAASVYTYFQHREDDMRLFGFLNKSRLEFFKKLISVNGVGTKVALGIISNIPVEDMCNAIITENVLVLKSIPGVGPKMASKIIFELKDKVVTEEIVTKTTVKDNTNTNEAISALKVLGYAEKELVNCINNIDTNDKSVQDIIKLCLKYLQN